MKLAVDQLPDGAIDEAIAGLKAALPAIHKPNPLERVLVRLAARRGETGLHVPHPLYVLDPEILISGGGLDDARHVGWRLLVSSPRVGPGEPAWSFLDLAGQIDTHFSRLHQSPAATTFVRAMRLAESWPPTGSYALRSLEVPVVYMTMLWLSNQTDDEWDRDILVVVRSRLDDLQPLSHLSGEDFVKTLRAVLPTSERGMS